MECEPDACELIRKNRAKFQTYNLILIEGRAPDALADLPAPDAVFIGGTKGGMEAVLDEVLGKNPNARICISAIALETLSAAVAALTATACCGGNARSRSAAPGLRARLHLLMANKPHLPYHRRTQMIQFLVAAPCSGSGKTTLTCALLAALKRRGQDPCSFKSGPDYIDPMFHRAVLGVESHNLDLFFSAPETVRTLYAQAAARHGGSRVRGCHGLLRWTGRRE